MILHFNKDFVLGALKAIELFKVVFDVNKNVIITEQNEIHINNTELLIQERNFGNKDFQFGFNFVIEQIEKYRERLCINPIFYLLFLEQILLKSTKEHLIALKSAINDLRSLFDSYCQSSKITAIRPNFDELNIITQEFVKDYFLKEVLKRAYGNKFVLIQEEITNEIQDNPYYHLKCTKYGKENHYEDIEVIVWFSPITKKELQDFIDFCMLNHKRVAVFFNEADKDAWEQIKDMVHYANSIVFFHYAGLKFYDIMKDINILSGKTDKDTFYDNSFGAVYDYNFGKLKEIKFIDGTAHILSGRKYDDYKSYLTYLKTEKSIERLSMLRGDGIVIKCKEDLIDSVRLVVSLARSIYTKGIFYDEITALEMFLFYFLKSGLTKDKKYVILTMLEKVLKEILRLYGSDFYNEILENAYAGKLKYYNPITNEIQTEKRYVSREMYLLMFEFLLSNLNLLISIKE